jgi:chaperonin GroEL
MEKLIKQSTEIADKIIRAVDTITDPIRQTLSPRGGNVIFESDGGEITVTNDGVTIARAINVEDPFENAIIQIIKEAALKTNTKAGDGTSTTILFNSVLTKGGLKLTRDGMNQREVVGWYREFAEELKKSLGKMKQTIKSDADLFNVACISANNDKEIAADVVKIVRTAGEFGFIFVEPSATSKTEIVEDSGFIVQGGLFKPELGNNMGVSAFLDVPILVTDKRLYYAEEAETILNTCLKNGYKEVVVVAQDFIGDALPFFIANHKKGAVRVILVKDPHIEKSQGATVEDLAHYLDGEVVAEKNGTIVDKLSISDFYMAKKVYADAQQTVIVREDETSKKRLNDRIKGLKAEFEKFGDEGSEAKNFIQKRLASLTNGIVTLRIGARTPIELKEKHFRYEDSISAARAAVKDGYLVGGGLSILRAYQDTATKWKDTPEVNKVFRELAEASVRQIAENSGLHGNTVLLEILKNKNKNYGFNALTQEYGDLLKDGVIDPYTVTEMAIDNSVSIASAILSSNYYIVNKPKDDKSST